MKKILTISIFLLLSLSSCAPAIFGGTALGGKLIMQDKTVGESLSDTSIWTKIRSKMIKKKIDNLFGSITVKVHEGRVLLTGTVPHRESILEILKVCWDTQGVKEVINELKVEKKGQSSILTYTKDSWITTQARSKLLFSNIKSVNFSVETIDSVIYLFGIARSQSELDKTTEKLSSISGVKKVVSYVRVIQDIQERIQNTRGETQNRQESLDIEEIDHQPSQNQNKKFGQVKIEDEEIFDKDYDLKK